jgi:hypothetical protein
MSLSNRKPLEQVWWLMLLVPFIAGTWCASEVVGQAVNSDPAYAEALDGSVANAISLLESSKLAHQQPDIVADQLILTKNSCRTTATVHVSARDEIWLVSARELNGAPCDISNLCCCRLENGAWQDSDLNELVARHSTDKTRATTIYVHGNRTDLSFAKARGLQVYQTAFQDTSCSRPPIRFVIFAWKSEKDIRRPVTDFSIKSGRAVEVGKTFAQMLGQFEDRNMAIIGFSLGTQVVLSGLTCAEQQESNIRQGLYRVALIAPALDPTFVRTSLCRFPHNTHVADTRVFLNHDDRAIKAAQLIVRRRSRANITSLRDLAASSGACSNPIQVFDITWEISKRHSVTGYALSSTVRSGLAQMLSDVQGSALLPFETPSVLTIPPLETVVDPTD